MLSAVHLSDPLCSAGACTHLKHRSDIKFGKERLCASLLPTKQCFISGPLGSNPCARSCGESAALETPAFNELPNQLARERRAPSLAQPASSPCPLRSSLPFSICLPFPPRQGAAQADAGSGSAPARPKSRRGGRRAQDEPEREPRGVTVREGGRRAASGQRPPGTGPSAEPRPAQQRQHERVRRSQLQVSGKPRDSPPQPRPPSLHPRPLVRVPAEDRARSAREAAR